MADIEVAVGMVVAPMHKKCPACQGIEGIVFTRRGADLKSSDNVVQCLDCGQRGKLSERMGA